MNAKSITYMTALVAATQIALGCSRFVWHEDPFTPDQAPTSETLVAGRDTTYVLKGSAYWLLANQRSALWNREVMDDVAWRYHALFGEAPPLIAIRIDSVATSDSTTTWRGVPFARVAVRRRTPDADAKKQANREREVDDSVRVRMFAGPMLAATAAETWLKAGTLDAARLSDSQPGGPSRVSTATAAVPAWLEAGALRILGSAGAVDRANAELSADSKHIVPLASLFTTAWKSPPNAMEIARPGVTRFDLADQDRRQDVAAARERDRRDAASGASSLFIAQSVSVLSYIHERDPALVARLADELARGGSIPDVLAASSTLPHDVAGLDAAWRDWLKKTQRSRR